MGMVWWQPLSFVSNLSWNRRISMGNIPIVEEIVWVKRKKIWIIQRIWPIFFRINLLSKHSEFEFNMPFILCSFFLPFRKHHRFINVHFYIWFACNQETKCVHWNHEKFKTVPFIFFSSFENPFAQLLWIVFVENIIALKSKSLDI